MAEAALLVSSGVLLAIVSSSETLEAMSLFSLLLSARLKTFLFLVCLEECVR